MKRLFILAAALAALAPFPAAAQATYPTAAAGVRAPGQVPLQCNASGAACAPVTAANPVPVTASLSGADAGVTPAATTVAASSLVACAAACNLYGFSATTGAVAGYLLLFDAVAAPADGVVQPAWCMPIAVTTGIDVNWRAAPRRMTTGATLVFSSTGCFTKTASATAFISAGSK